MARFFGSLTRGIKRGFRSAAITWVKANRRAAHLAQSVGSEFIGDVVGHFVPGKEGQLVAKAGKYAAGKVSGAYDAAYDYAERRLGAL